MGFLKRIKKKMKITLASLVKPEWHYIKALDSIKTTSRNPIAQDSLSLFDFVMKEELKEKPVVFFEFGVFEGRTFKYWVDNYSNPESESYGFDTFTGLPEDWNAKSKGSYSAQGKIP